MEPSSVKFSNQDAVLAECEALLRRTLDLIDGYRVNRLIGARIAHLIHDVSQERRPGSAAEEVVRPVR